MRKPHGSDAVRLFYVEKTRENVENLPNYA